jgi:hypothetical protein
MDAWLTGARDALADAGGLPREEIELGDDDAKALLDLARIAARTSGDRRNAPLLCYLVGRAQGGGATVEELAAAVRRSTS